MANQPLLRN